MNTAHATIRSEKAARYLVQLCKHFAHKIPARWEDDTGHADFGFGTCDMTASVGTLQLSCSAPEPEGLERVKYIVEDHVVRFAWKEKISVTWLDGPAA